jgi:regulatory protein
MTPTPPSLKARALRLLSTREHSRQELQRKLARFEEMPGTLELALNELQARGFISEERVLASVVHQRAGKWGQRRLRQELEAKGLDSEAVAQTLSELAPSELARARAVWQKKFGQPGATPAERARQMRFLGARGFMPETIRKVLRAPDDEEASTPPTWLD